MSKEFPVISRLRGFAYGCMVFSMAGIGGCGAPAGSASSPASATASKAPGAQERSKDQVLLASVEGRANAGDADAQYQLGLLYMQGKGVPQSDANAAPWLQKAAAQGYPKAEVMLGILYGMGAGVPRDDVKYIEWVRKAAEQGDAEGQLLLGEAYVKGRGVPQSDTTGADWYRKSAMQGNVDAQSKLAEMYAKGQGVAQDAAQSAAWYEKTASQGDKYAQETVAELYAAGRGVAQDYATAAGWYRKSAEQGNPDAQYSLGLLYFNGHGVPKDDAEAAAWFRKAADQWNAAAMRDLGAMYTTGQGVARDDAKAVEWFQKAANRGNGQAEFDLAGMYEQGRGVAKNEAAATEWYQKAAAQGIVRDVPLRSDGLSYANDLQAIYAGAFDRVSFDAGSADAAALVGAYEEAYGDRCPGFMPANKVEITLRKCEREAWDDDDSGGGAKYCESWVDAGTGKYADPAVDELAKHLANGQVAHMAGNVLEMLRNPLAILGSQVGANLRARRDMYRLIDLNACGSPAIKRFQDNLLRFGWGQQPTVMKGYLRQDVTEKVLPALDAHAGSAYFCDRCNFGLEPIIQMFEASSAKDQMVRECAYAMGHDEDGSPTYAFYYFWQDTPPANIKALLAADTKGMLRYLGTKAVHACPASSEEALQLEQAAMVETGHPPQ